MANSEAIKLHVNTYLNDIRKETWDDYRWECKLILQIPDFVRSYKEAPSDTASLDPVYGSLEPSIQAMKELLRNYVPNLFLEYHPTLMQEKLDAARDTIQFLEKALREMDHIAYERKKLERDVYLTAGRLLDYLSDGDDDYIDPYLGDAMYEDGDDDSDQDPSDFSYSFYNRHINEIQSFFLKHNLLILYSMQDFIIEVPL
jgi:hypothetical protein